MQGKLLRELGLLQSISVIVGTTIGAGIFVITAQGASIMGPATPLGFLLGIPVIIATAYVYSVYMSGPLGRHPGGAYVHISRTWDSVTAGYSFMWLKWVGEMGGLALIAISFGEAVHYWESLTFLPPKWWAVVFLGLIWLLQLGGIDLFGKVQTAFTAVLVVILLLLGVPGLLYVDPSNFTPVFPQELYGDGYVQPFLQGIATLLFAYLGFEAVAQTAGETENPEQTLPKVFVLGMLSVGLLYVLVAVVVIGVLPWQEVAASDMPLTAAAETYFPVGMAGLVAFASLLAYTTTLNSIFLVPSRILYAFGVDDIVPEVLTHVNDRFRTPDVGLTLTFVIVSALVLTSTFTFLVSLLLLSLLLLYAAHSFSAAALPYVRPKLYERCDIQPRPVTLVAVAGFSGVMMVLFIWQTLSLSALGDALGMLARGEFAGALTTSPVLLLFAFYLVGMGLFFGYQTYRRRGDRDAVSVQTENLYGANDD